MQHKAVFIMFVMIFFTTGVGMAAQSTKDVPVSEKVKDSILQKVRPKQPVTVADEDEYIIGPGDIIAVSIYDEGDMSVNTPDSKGDKNEGQAVASNGILVRSDGRVSLKDIGDVEVVGLTLPKLADYLKQLYSEIYDDPILVTSLIQSNSKRYTVMGEVNTPGTFKLGTPTTLVQVVAIAGGFTKWADHKIIVVRKDLKKGDNRVFNGHKLNFDYDDFVSGDDLEKNIYVRSDDVIIVK